MRISRSLKRWRENYYASLTLAAVANPVHRICRRLSSELPRKIKKNGTAIRLPNGRTLRIARDAGVGLASLLFWSGWDSYEPQTSRTLQFFFERASTFIDVGAHYGFYSLLAGLWNPNLQIVSFEPVPQIYAALRKNIEFNGLEQRVAAHQIALAERTRRATFHMPKPEGKDCEATGTLAINSWQEKQHSPTFEVEAARFDDFEQTHPIKVDLVKLDVEDYEAEVLAGMQATLRRDHPFVICEILPRAHRNERTRDIVQKLGYTPYWITSSGYIRVSRFDFDRDSSQDFLLSPVEVPREVVTDLGDLWSARDQQIAQRSLQEVV